MQPSVNRLIEIVGVLGVPISAIFEGDHESDAIDAVRIDAPANRSRFPASPWLARRQRFRRFSGRGWCIDGAMLVHDGHEAGRVVSGRFAFEFTEGTVELGPGDALSFWADHADRVVKTSADTTAVSIWLTVRAGHAGLPH